MFIHDIIKINYINLGYLPNYPFYLTSDIEMIEAFRKPDGFFHDNYPCPCDDLQEPYEALKESIWTKLDAYIAAPMSTAIPDWVYSYMLNATITYTSDEADIAYLYELTGVQPEDTLAEFSDNLAEACYATSQEWMRKRPSQYRDRPSTMFGEPHVVKCLRLKQANILIEAEGA